MKKFVLLMILLGVGLTACMYENGAYYSPGNYENYESALDLLPTVQMLNEEIGGLQAAQTFSNEFGVAFLLRNETGHRLYYNDDFRVDSLAMSERRNPAGLQFINHGSVKESHVSWDGSRATGVYTFERDFFLDASLTELYTTLTFEFDIIAWYHFTPDAPPIPDDIQARRDEQARAHLAFKIAGGPSEIIVPASEISVSRTEVAFSTINLSAQSFMHGLMFDLLVYEDGWKPAPAIVESMFVHLIGIGMQSGEVIEDHFNFEGWFGALENGRYMIMRQHGEDHMRPGAPRVQEILMVEFIIDDDTPMRLGGI